jgi:hypothetical protein
LADRFCRNCGHELAETDRFCPNCGTPVHQAAHVPTPEADVPVPPPPQPQETGTSAPPQQQVGAPQQSWTQRHARLVGCLGLIGVLVFFFVLIPALTIGGGGGGGGGNQAESPRERVEKGEKAEPREEQQPREQEPQPPPEPKEPAPQPITLSGQASQATDFFRLEQGLAVFEMQHQGQMNFIATLLDEQGNEVGYALGNEIGTVQFSSALRIPSAGRYIFDVDADGPWSVTIRQPRLLDAPEQTSFRGENNAATSLFQLSSGLKRVTATHQGQGNFIINMLDAEGREVAFALVNEIGSGEFSSTVNVPQDGVYLFTVEAEGPWTIKVE